MSDDEAKGILNAEYLKLRARGYSDLAELVDRKAQAEITGFSGNVYHVELEAFWDDDDHTDLRVVASIDDGGLRALLPFTDSFTISPSGLITDHSAA